MTTPAKSSGRGRREGAGDHEEVRAWFERRAVMPITVFCSPVWDDLPRLWAEHVERTGSKRLPIIPADTLSDLKARMLGDA